MIFKSKNRERNKLIKLVQKYQRLEQKGDENLERVKNRAKDNLDYKILSEKIWHKNRNIKREQEIIVYRIVSLVGKRETEIPELGISIEPIMNTLAIWKTGNKPRHLQNYFR